MDKTLAGQTMSSANFRKRYATLTVPTIVTVNGHVIGTWVPGSDPEVRTAQIGDDWIQNRQTTQVSSVPPHPDRSAQQERDAILKRINRKTGEAQ